MNSTARQSDEKPGLDEADLRRRWKIHHDRFVKTRQVGKLELGERAGRSAQTVCRRCGKACEPIPLFVGPEPKRPLPTLCPACRAIARTERQAAEIAREREAAAQKRRNLLANLSNLLADRGIPARLTSARLDSCEDLPTRLVQAMRTWAKGPNGLVLFVGPPGCGKTWTAVATLAEALAREVVAPRDVQFITEADYLAEMRRGFEGGRGPWSNHGEPTLLVFDDLGAGSPSAWAIAEVEQLVVRRHAQLLPTVFTSNLDLPELARLLGGRVVSRLQEDRQFFVFPGLDLRAKR